MDDVFVGEIRAVGFNYAPRGWALCQGQLLPINQNAALYSLIGNTYGGNGTTTFGLPDLRSRAIVHAGQGPGLSNYVPGQASGTENVSLLQANLPLHNHTVTTAGSVVTNNDPGSQSSPANNYLATSPNRQYSDEPSGTMAANMISGMALPAGSGAPHPNMMPYLAVNYIIALTGIFPQRP